MNGPGRSSAARSIPNERSDRPPPRRVPEQQGVEPGTAAGVEHRGRQATPVRNAAIIASS